MMMILGGLWQYSSSIIFVLLSSSIIMSKDLVFKTNKQQLNYSTRQSLTWTLQSLEKSPSIHISTLTVCRRLCTLNNNNNEIIAPDFINIEQLLENEAGDPKVLEKICRVCSLRGLVGISYRILSDLLRHMIESHQEEKLLLHDQEEEKYVVQSIAYMPLIVALQRQNTAKSLEMLDLLLLELSSAYQLCNDINTNSRNYNTNSTSDSTTVSLDLSAFNCYISSLSNYSKSMLNKAFHIISVDYEKYLGKNNHPDIISFNTLLSGAADYQDEHLMNRINELRIDRGLKAGLYTYNANLKFAVKGKRYEEAVSIIDCTLSKEGLTLNDPYFIDLALLPLVKLGRPLDALKLIRNMGQLSSNRKTSRALASFLSTLVGEGEVLVARTILDKFMLDKDSSLFKVYPQTRHFNIVIQGYREQEEQDPIIMKKNRKAAYGLVKTMIRSNVRPDAYTLSSVIAMQIRSETLRKVWNYGIDRLDIVPSQILCHAYISQLGYLGDVSGACRVFDEMGRNNITRSLSSWNILLKVFSLKDVSECVIHYEPKDLPNKNIEWCFSQYVNGWKPDEASENIIRLMCESPNVPRPDSKSYCLAAAALAHGTRGNSKIAKEWLHDCIKHGINLDGRLVNSLFQCFGNDVDEALSCWKHDIRNHILEIKGKTARELSIRAAYHGILKICGKALRADVAVRVTYAMKKDGIETDDIALNCYKAGKRLAKLEGRRNFFEGPYESILVVECSKYSENDKRRKNETRIRIIL